MATPFPFGSGNVLTAAQMNAITSLPINDQTASYVALVGDVGKRIVMNVGSANTVTINNSVFAASDTIFIANKGSGATTITAGAGVTINTSSSLVLAQHGGGTLVALSASVFTFFSQQTATYGTATGGTALTPWSISTKNYNGSQFTADATLTVTKAGLFDVLMFAGAGGGGNGASFYPSGGGGGAAGGKVVATVYLAATTYSIVVGAGGAGGTNNNEFGSPGLATGITNVLAAVGGGGGLGNEAGAGRISTTFSRGGCGGGGASGSVTGGSAVLSQGFAGGTATTNGNIAGAGGGGVAAVGQPNVTTTAGAGGTGFDVSTFIGGSTVTKGTGGNGGSGAGAGAAGAANSANGGVGGGLGDHDGGAGGSGYFVIRFEV